MAEHLFTERRLDDVLEERLKRAEATVDELPASKLNGRKKPIRRALAELAIESPELRRDDVQMDVIEGPAMTVRLRIPFDGDPQLFNLRPSEYSIAPPEATVRADEHEIEFVRDFPAGTKSSEVAQWAGAAADAVEQYLLWQAADIGLHRRELEERIADLVEERRERLREVAALQSELDDVRDV
jgi:hypothetical protein